MQADVLYHRLKERLLEFRESRLERQARVSAEFERLTKGSKDALAFLPLWERCITEMERVGLGMTEEQLLVAWMTRLNPTSRYEVYKDKRYYEERNAETGVTEQVLRGVKSWQEPMWFCVSTRQSLWLTKLSWAALCLETSEAMARKEAKRSP